MSSGFSCHGCKYSRAAMNGTTCPQECTEAFYRMHRFRQFKLKLKRFACGFIKATLALVVGLMPAGMLYLIARPELAKDTPATWLEALLWVTALIGVCAAMSVIDSVDERSKPKC